MTDPRTRWKQGAALGEIAGNPDGTFDGIKALSAISGLEPGEIGWMFRRLQELKAEGHDTKASKAVVKAEAKHAPWRTEKGSK